MMDRDIVLLTLKQHQTALAAFGVKSLAVFGSLARGEAEPGSDIDFLVTFTQTPVTFDDYMDVKIYLEDLLENPIDLVIADSVHPRLQPYINKDKLYVT
jgi:predicted nucleotidyltransferase